jgi:hypothetical protein
VEWYKGHIQDEGHQNLVVIPDLPKPDIAKFTAIENEKLEK